MEIVLLRHGKPKLDRGRRMTAAEFGNWVVQYNAAGIDEDCPPPAAAREQAERCALIVCSDLPRSLASAKALGVEDVGLCHPLFREMGLPHAPWHFPRLVPTVWTVLFRLIWTLGYSAQAESFIEAINRARRCADRLANLAGAGDRRNTLPLCDTPEKKSAIMIAGYEGLNRESWYFFRRS